MSTKPSILELLARPENNANATEVASAMAPASFREEEGEMYVDIRIATDAVIGRWGAYCDDEFIGDYDQQMVLADAANIDDTRLKNGIPLIDSHSSYSILGQFGMLTKWWLQDNALYGTFKLSAIAKMTGVADSIKNQTIKFVSIGAMILKDSWDRTGARPLRTITLCQPYEVSLVVAGAIPDAMILSMNPKLKELLMSTAAKPDATVQKVETPPAPPAPAAETVELTAEQIADEALKLAGLPARGSVTVLDAGQKDVAVVLEAAKLLDVHSVIEAARKEGKTLTELKAALSAAAKDRAAKLAAADKETSISSELPLPQAAKTEQQAGKKKNWGEVALAIIKKQRERA